MGCDRPKIDIVRQTLCINQPHARPNTRFNNTSPHSIPDSDSSFRNDQRLKIGLRSQLANQINDIRLCVITSKHANFSELSWFNGKELKRIALPTNTNISCCSKSTRHIFNTTDATHLIEHHTPSSAIQINREQSKISPNLVARLIDRTLLQSRSHSSRKHRSSSRHPDNRRWPRICKWNSGEQRRR